MGLGPVWCIRASLHCALLLEKEMVQCLMIRQCLLMWSNTGAHAGVYVPFLLSTCTNATAVLFLHVNEPLLYTYSSCTDTTLPTLASIMYALHNVPNTQGRMRQLGACVQS